MVVEGEEADVGEGEEASEPGRRESASERSMVGCGRGGGGEQEREAIVGLLCSGAEEWYTSTSVVLVDDLRVSSLALHPATPGLVAPTPPQPEAAPTRV